MLGPHQPGFGLSWQVCLVLLRLVFVVGSAVVVAAAGRWVSRSGGSHVRGRSVGIFMQVGLASHQKSKCQGRYLLIGSGLQDSTTTRMM